MSRDIPNSDQIKLYFHCGLCMQEKPANQSPRDWGRLEVGWTPIGIQVWCKRHNVNVIHIDLEGTKHPANMNMTVLN